MKMRVGVLLIGAVLLLPGCASPSSAPSPSATVDPEATFLSELRDTKAFFGSTDQQLITIGKDVCDALANGSTYADAKSMLGVAGLDSSDAETVIFASAEAYCPDQAR